MPDLIPRCALTEQDIQSALNTIRDEKHEPIIDNGWLLIPASDGRSLTAIMEAAMAAGWSAGPIDTGTGVAVNLNGHPAEDFFNSIGGYTAHELYRRIQRNCGYAENSHGTATVVNFTGTELTALDATLPKLVASIPISIA